MQRLVLVIALVACRDSEPRPIVEKYVDALVASDRDQVLHIRGTATDIRMRMFSAERRVQFVLGHGTAHVTVIHKGNVPDLFRDGVPVTVTGTWAETADVRDALGNNGFAPVADHDVIVSRDVRVEL